MTSSPSDPSDHPLAAFVAGLPKAELHVHQVGSAPLRVVAELAARHPGVVPADPDELGRFYRFRDFAHFVDVYLAVVDLVRTPEDVRLLTYEVAREMASQQVRYAELTLTPYTAVKAGVPIEAFTEAVEDARIAAERDLGLVLRWIYDIPGEFGAEAGEVTAAYAVEHGPESLVGFGLGGPEIGVPRPQFQPAFDRARAAGLHSVPHAGETTGPQTIRDAMDLLGAERIGHGTSLVQDEALLAEVVERGIHLEVCPTSNLATGAVADLAEHPVRQLAEAGVDFSINSDDPPMFGTTLERELLVAADLLGLDAAGVTELAGRAVRASFAPHDVRRAVLAEQADYLAAWQTP